MRSGSRRLLWALAGAGLLATGCVVTRATRLPAEGRLVWVDQRAGSSWTGDAKLLQQAGANCLVALRGSSGLVERRWIPCAYVHSKTM